jgi:hypothetical protein
MLLVRPSCVPVRPQPNTIQPVRQDTYQAELSAPTKGRPGVLSSSYWLPAGPSHCPGTNSGRSRIVAPGVNRGSSGPLLNRRGCFFTRCERPPGFSASALRSVYVFHRSYAFSELRLAGRINPSRSSYLSNLHHWYR